MGRNKGRGGGGRRGYGCGSFVVVVVVVVVVDSLKLLCCSVDVSRSLAQQPKP